MSNKEITGICRLCGKEGKISFEHVPPHSAFNTRPVKTVGIEEILYAESEERMPWDIADLKGSISRKGLGGYFLCEDCNNKTGAWYGAHYKKFAHCICSVANEIIAQDMYGAEDIRIEGLRPLAIYKQIITMFCDINPGFFGDSTVREFLLDKENKNFDTDKYKVFIYVPGGNMQKIVGESAFIPMTGSSKSFLVSEITSYPIGLILFVDKPDDVVIQGTDLSPFAKMDYKESANIVLSLNRLDVNTIFPMDYRTELEVRKDSQANMNIDKV